MKKKMFVFAVLASKKSNANLQVLSDRLTTNFHQNNISIDFSGRDQLLSGRIENVGFYISFIKDKDQLKQWLNLANLFDLMHQKKSVTKKRLLKRYNEMARSVSNSYQQIHYRAGLSIIEELEKFKHVVIYSFQ